MLGLSLRSYGSLHLTIGLMALMQSLVHAVIATWGIGILLTDDVQLYGLLAGIMLLLLCMMPLLRRHQFELFLTLHLACAMFLAYSLWRHVGKSDGLPRNCVIAAAGLFVTTFALRLGRSLFRNLTYGHFLSRLTLISDCRPDSDDAFQVNIVLPRPWEMQAGEWVRVSVPRVGFWYLFQSHPFMVAWSEDDGSSMSLLVKPQSGFTRRFLGRVKPHAECWAWVDGPYGPGRIGRHLTPRQLGHYGRIVVFATGIGIAAQISYIRETLKGIGERRVRTQRISLVWQMDNTDNLDLVCPWLQHLVIEDKNYNLELHVHDASRAPSTDDPKRFGAHGLIQVFGGEADWEVRLQTEMEEKKGALLIMVSTQHHI
ncbi:hypothetical protein FQN50_003607 [Emmonsiellopsis sp. PD_5]|nr:hypothetical protein FQN50_003607 [Emmonsiellopsis sp. PD_5]